MNTAYRFCICTVSVVAFGLLTGCQGLQGIRYHEEFGKLSGEDGMIAHDAGFEVGMGDALGDGSSPAPHPRFHPLPTRPVFEPQGVAAIGTGARDAEPVEAPPATTEQTASSVLTAEQDSPVKLASASETLLSQMLPGKDDSSETPEEAKKVDGSSRRQTQEPAEDAPPAPVAKIETDVPAFQPVKTSAPTVNDGWRPRVASP